MTARQLRGEIAELRHTPPLLLLQKVLRRVPFKPFDVGKLCFLRLDGVPQVPRGLLRGGSTVRRATPDDLPGLVALQNKRATFLERFAAGDLCLVALADDRIVGYEWFCEKAEHRETSWGLRIVIPGDFVYAYDAYIDPAYRNTGVWLRFKAYLSEWMLATGKRGVLTFVDYGNLPSLRTHLRFGFAPSETVLAMKVMGVSLFRTLRAAATTTWMCVGYFLVTRAPMATRSSVDVSIRGARWAAVTAGSLLHVLGLPGLF